LKKKFYGRDRDGKINCSREIIHEKEKAAPEHKESSGLACGEFYR
jgi:hypothetical protein